MLDFILGSIKLNLFFMFDSYGLKIFLPLKTKYFETDK